MVQPPCVSHFGNPIADKRRSRCAQRNQFVRVYRQVAGIFASERSLGRAVLQKITCHPVIFAGPREILHLFSEIASVRFDATFPGGEVENLTGSGEYHWM